MPKDALDNSEAAVATVFGKAWPTNIATSAEIARNTIAATAMRSIAAGDNEEDDDRPSGVCSAALDLEGRPIRGMGAVEYPNAPLRIRLPQLRTSVRVPDARRPDAVVSVLRK